MTAVLIDPQAAPEWPEGAATDRAYIEAFASGSTPLVSNLRTQVMGLALGERLLPVTVNTAEYGDAYVCLPHTAYALYSKAELDLVDAGPAGPLLGLAASGAGAVMRAARMNKIVHAGNWMLSTNLHGGWRGEGLPDLRETLADAFPDHLLAVRSLNDWSDPALVQAFRDDGWRLLPSRQVWVTDDLEAEWRPRRDTRRDLALLAGACGRIDSLERLRPGDADRIADLYAQLYVGKYSPLNPIFTPAWIEMTHRTGFLKYRGVRASDGRLETIVGCLVRGGMLTTPVVGYDTTRPAAEGLYRMASALLALMTLEAGARLNGSAGAAAFKRHRGARGVIEYTAYDARHLSAARRGALAAMQTVLEKAVVPMMKARGLWSAWPAAVAQGWLPVATERELRRGRPLARTLMDRPIVVFAARDGAAVLVDRCPHRNAALSRGRVREGALECPYHGWRFSGRGECVLAPGAAEASRHGAQALPVQTYGGLVFTTLAETPAPFTPPPHPVGVDGFDTFLWPVRASRARLIDAIENLLDPAHPHFLHEGIVRSNRHRKPVDVTVRIGPDCAEAIYDEHAQASALMPRMLEGKRARSLGRFFPPSVGQIAFDSDAGLRLAITVFFTPETETRVRPFAHFATPKGIAPAFVKEALLRAFHIPVLAQDQAALSAQLDNVERFGGPKYALGPLDFLFTAICKLADGERPEASEQRFQVQL